MSFAAGATGWHAEHERGEPVLAHERRDGRRRDP